MTDVTITGNITSPSTGYCTAYITGAKAAQNDYLIVDNFEVIYCVSGSIEPASGDSAPADPDIDDTTKNKIKLTGSVAGTAHLIIAGVPK